MLPATTNSGNVTVEIGNSRRSVKNVSVQTSLKSHQLKKLRLTNKRLHEKVYRLQRQNKILKTKKKSPDFVASDKQIIKIVSTRFGKPGEMFCEQIKLGQAKNKHGHRFSNSLKQMALKQYFQSPVGYRSLCKEMTLPSKSTLVRMVKDIPSSPGFHNYTFEKMKAFNKMIDRDKCCAVTLDEITIKQHLFYDKRHDKIIGFHDTGECRKNKAAGNALVFMARGFSAGWKQPLGYFNLCSSCDALELKELAIKAITNLQNIGFHPLALINDQGLGKLGTALTVTKEKPTFFVNGVEIVYLFDIPHLLKSTRNNLLNYNFFLKNGDVASWDDIKKTHEHFHGHYSGMINVSTSHLNPNKWEKMSVKLAAKVLSSSVSKSISLLLRKKKIDKKASGTSDFIKKMDQLFDKLNAHLYSHPNEFKTVYRGTATEISFLEEMIDYISAIKLMDVKKINLTHQCDIVYEKNQNLIKTFEKLFLKYEESTGDHEEFASEFKDFFKKIRVFKKIKSRPNLTSKVDLYYSGSILNDETIDNIFKNDIRTIFSELKNVLNNISVCNKDLDVTNKVKFLNGWITTIRGVMILFENLKPFDFGYLKTRRVNQDALENFLELFVDGMEIVLIRHFVSLQ